MKDTRIVIALISLSVTCLVVIACLFINTGKLLESVDNSTEALNAVKVVILEHTTKMADLENRANLNDLRDTYVRDDVSELQDSVKLLTTLNTNIEKLLQKKEG